MPLILILWQFVFHEQQVVHLLLLHFAAGMCLEDIWGKSLHVRYKGVTGLRESLVLGESEGSKWGNQASLVPVFMEQLFFVCLLHL